MKNSIISKIWKRLSTTVTLWVELFGPAPFWRGMRILKNTKNYIQKSQDVYPGDVRSLSDDQLKFRKSGFLLWPKPLLSPAEVSKIKSLFSNTAELKYHYSDAVLDYPEASKVQKPIDYLHVVHFHDVDKLILEKISSSGIVENLQRIHGCYFRPKFIQIYRSLPRTQSHFRSGNYSSFQWHHDSSPPLTYKVMVLLDNVTPENGPLQFLEGSHLRAGLIPSYGASRYPDRVQKNYETLNFLGEPGSAALFDVAGIHRGGRVINGTRDVIVVELIPSTLPFDEHFRKFGLLPASDQKSHLHPERSFHELG